MKLSDYAKRVGVTYKTAWQWWKDERLDAYQLPTGTVIVQEPGTGPAGVALSARVASAGQKGAAARTVPLLRALARLSSPDAVVRRPRQPARTR